VRAVAQFSNPAQGLRVWSHLGLHLVISKPHSGTKNQTSSVFHALFGENRW
jgi:hypothetical protein